MNTPGQRYKIKRPKVVADRPANTIGDIPIKQLYIVKKTAEGLPQKQIAANLGISPKAIDWHLRKFREVTGLGCIALRTRWAVRNGLIAACWLLALLGLATNGLAQPMPRVVAPAPDNTYPAQLAWSSVKDATAYRLFYGTNGITWEQNTTVVETNLTLPLPIGPTYYFKVRAQAGLDESDDSNIAMLNTAPGPYLNHWTPVIAMSWTTPAGQTSVLQFSTQEGEWSDVLETTNAITATTQALVGVQGKWRTRYK